jgi:ERI1 exoribonuclease 3
VEKMFWQERKRALDEKINTQKRQSSTRHLSTKHLLTKPMWSTLYRPPTQCTPDYFAVLDFEATCEANNINSSIEGESKFQQEIIEFPIILMTTMGKIVDTFHHYVKPVYHPTLSTFCTQLTGIEQKTVDQAKEFPHVWELAQEFLSKHGATEKNTIFFTCGNWDLETMLPSQIALSHKYQRQKSKGGKEEKLINFPLIFRTSLNIKKEYQKLYGRKVISMVDMLRDAQLELKGRHHSGIDDTKNIAAVLQVMVKDGYHLISSGGANEGALRSPFHPLALIF